MPSSPRGAATLSRGCLICARSGCASWPNVARNVIVRSTGKVDGGSANTADTTTPRDGVGLTRLGVSVVDGCVPRPHFIRVQPRHPWSKIPASATRARDLADPMLLPKAWARGGLFCVRKMVTEKSLNELSHEPHPHRYDRPTLFHHGYRPLSPRTYRPQAGTPRWPHP